MQKRILVITGVLTAFLLVGRIIILDSATIADDCSDLPKQKNYSWLLGDSGQYHQLKQLREPEVSGELSLSDLCGTYNISLRLL